MGKCESLRVQLAEKSLKEEGLDAPAHGLDLSRFFD